MSDVITPEAQGAHMTVPVHVMHCNKKIKNWNADIDFVDRYGEAITVGQLKKILLATQGIPPGMQMCTESCRLFLQMDNDAHDIVELNDNYVVKEDHIFEMSKKNSYLLLTDGVEGLESFKVKPK